MDTPLPVSPSKLGEADLPVVDDLRLAPLTEGERWQFLAVPQDRSDQAPL